MLSSPPQHPLLATAIYPTLIRLAIPNIIALSMAVLVAMAETFYIGLLGIEQLAAMALVFPFVMLMQMMSNGAMGSGVASAISQALGKSDHDQAAQLAFHALMIGSFLGLIYSSMFVLAGPIIYTLLGGRAAPLTYAIEYGQVIFSGAWVVWICNTFASIIRGTGNMRIPSTVLFSVAWIQVIVGGSLGLGIGPFPLWGMRGVALGQVSSMVIAVGIFIYYLFFVQTTLHLKGKRIRFKLSFFSRILSVGAVACISPAFSILTALVMTRLISTLGTNALAGYSIGQRLEFLIIPISFGVGMAAVPMIGMAIGANQVSRARQVAKRATILGALIIGSISLTASVIPNVWSGLFTTDTNVLHYANLYLRVVAPALLFLGIGLILYFASLGAGKAIGPVIAAGIRFILVAICGVLLMLFNVENILLFYALVSLGMIVYAALTVWIVKRTQW